MSDIDFTKPIQLKKPAKHGDRVSFEDYAGNMSLIEEYLNAYIKSGIKVFDAEEFINFFKLQIQDEPGSTKDYAIIPTIGKVISMFNELYGISTTVKTIYESDYDFGGLLPTADKLNEIYFSEDEGLEVTEIASGDKYFLTANPLTEDDRVMTPGAGVIYTTTTGTYEVAVFLDGKWKIDNTKDHINAQLADIQKKLADLDANKLSSSVTIAGSVVTVEAALNAHDTKLKDAESALANRYTKDLVYTKSETNDKFDASKQYVDNLVSSATGIVMVSNNKDIAGGATLNFSGLLGSESGKVATRSVVFDSVKPVYDKGVSNEAKIKTITDTDLPAIRGSIVDKQTEIDSKADKTKVYTKDETMSKEEIEDAILDSADGILPLFEVKADKADVYTKAEVDASQRQQDQDRGSLAGRIATLEDATAFIAQTYKWNGVSTTTMTTPFDLKTLVLVDGGSFTFKDGDKVELAIQQVSSGAIVSHAVSADQANTPVQFRWDVNGSSQKGLDIDIASDGTMVTTLANGATLTNYRIYEIIKKVEQSTASTVITAAQADAKFQLKNDAAIIVAGYTTDENTAKKINYIDSKVEINKTALTGKVSKPASGTASTARFLVGGDGTLVSYTVPDVTGQITSATTGLQPKTMVAKPALMTATTVEGAVTEIFDSLTSVKTQSDTDHADLAALTPRVVTLESKVSLDDTHLVELETLLGL